MVPNLLFCNLVLRGIKMTDNPKIADEIKKMEYEPLDPVEKKLIFYSILTGVILLGVLVTISYIFFPAV
jgi:hypothetical protein